MLICMHYVRFFLRRRAGIERLKNARNGVRDSPVSKGHRRVISQILWLRQQIVSCIVDSVILSKTFFPANTARKIAMQDRQVWDTFGTCPKDFLSPTHWLQCSPIWPRTSTDNFFYDRKSKRVSPILPVFLSRWVSAFCPFLHFLVWARNLPSSDLEDVSRRKEMGFLLFSSTAKRYPVAI